MLRFPYMQDVSINTGLGSSYANKSTLCTQGLILILSPSGDNELFVCCTTAESTNSPVPHLADTLMTDVSSGKPGKPQEHKSPLSSHCAPGNMHTNARNTFPSLPS